MKLQQGKIVNILQGSPEWDALRAKRFTASEAPAMAGKSKYQSRNDLLKQKSTGIAPEVTPHQQRIFDDGHRAEAAARPIVEKIIGDDLYPVVLDDEEGGFMASMDGLNMMGEIGFEHKWLSADLAAQIDAGKLEEHYMIQLDQQFALSGADRIIFVGSDGTEENLKYLWIERDESRFKALEAGWNQFAKDLSQHEAPEAEQPKADGKAPDDLPALSVQVQGMVTASNLREFEESAMATLAGINTDLKTDDDFASAEKTVKFCKDVESRLDGAKENVLGQMQTVDEVVKTIDRIKEETRQIRLKLDKAVKDQKEQRKLEILNAARESWNKHMGDLEKALEQEADGLPVTLACSNADFAGAMKGKRTISSLQGACDDTLAAAKIEANETAELIRGNIAQLNEHAPDHKFLFRDFGQICMKPADDFAAVVKMRIADYQAEQDAKAKRDAEEAERQEVPAPETQDAPQADGERMRGPKIRTQAPNLQAQAEDTVTISRTEYDQLVHNSKMYLALAAAGVDNWEGYDVAVEIMQEAA